MHHGKTIFSPLFTGNHLYFREDFEMLLSVEPHREKKWLFCICKNKDADQLRGNREADQRLCFEFATLIVQSLYFLNLKFQASSHLVCLNSLVWVGPGRKP